MSEKKWYYVEDGNRMGPVPESELIELYQNDTVASDTYVWSKGMENWQKIQELSDLYERLEQEIDDQEESEEVHSEEEASEEGPNSGAKKVESLSDLSPEEGRWFIKVGSDRGDERELQYGPFSLAMLIKLKEQNRINAKTLVFTSGMDQWKCLAEFPDYEEVFHESAPAISNEDKRKHGRKPFVARMFFSDHEHLYEGVCRDISLGGMQVLVGGFPGKEGDEISLNVHPENDQHHFVANGKIVRLLQEGQGFSFEFKDLDDQAKRAINSFINE